MNECLKQRVTSCQVCNNFKTDWKSVKRGHNWGYMTEFSCTYQETSSSILNHLKVREGWVTPQYNKSIDTNSKSLKKGMTWLYLVIIWKKLDFTTELICLSNVNLLWNVIPMFVQYPSDVKPRYQDPGQRQIWYLGHQATHTQFKF